MLIAPENNPTGTVIFEWGSIAGGTPGDSAQTLSLFGYPASQSSATPNQNGEANPTARSGVAHRSSLASTALDVARVTTQPCSRRNSGQNIDVRKQASKGFADKRIKPYQERSTVLTRLAEHIRDRLMSAQFMRQTGFIAITLISAGAAVLLTTHIANLRAQGPGGVRTAETFFAALDTDKDGSLTKPELESSFNSWFTAWDTAHSGTLAQPEILAGIR